MRTPDEIKKGLEICSSRGDCAKCPYPEGECFSDLVEKDAHGYILQLENHIGELTEKVAQLEAALTEAKNDDMECIVEEELW